ncbi:unnamed protein product [Diplocarpon coronariae]|uniref:Uncharacterized protein n=1 Tax=Diplocarpon coronariae TaxID=2795749 RepID=A0A218YZJ9_9HELO|nr:hypothetical protein B2J93_6558 [Marssonina coronariae]
MPCVLYGPIWRDIARLAGPSGAFLSQYKLILAHSNQLEGLSMGLGTYILIRGVTRCRPRRLYSAAESATNTEIAPALGINIGRPSASAQSPRIPSAEQQMIVKLSQIQNVVVSARPGAGKTATAELIVAANPNRLTVLLTYSKRLQLETARRLESHQACDVFTFHGMASRLFSSVVFNDQALLAFRKQATPPVWSGEPYETIILDELQDCTDNLFWLICAFISAVTHAAGGQAPRLVVLGDEKQTIYNFMGADDRFLTQAPSILATLSPYSWTQLPLSKSFRLSHEMSAFVNQVFLGGEEYITGLRHGPKPLYMHGNIFDIETVARKLIPLIRRYGSARTAILAPSVRSNGALSSLTNHLSGFYGLPVAVSTSDEVSLDEKVVAGKISVSTFHQFKGNERDLVIVYGADAGFFEFQARDLPDDRCPNSIFVGLTRARKKLVVMHDDRQRPMPFINEDQLHKTAQYLNFSRAEMQGPAAVGKPSRSGLLLPKKVFASLVARHVPDETLDAICRRHLDINVAAAPLPESQHIAAPDKVLTHAAKQHYEAVSDLNGLAVVAAQELARLGTLTTLGHRPEEPLPDIPSDPLKQAAWLCRDACRYDAAVSRYKSRQIQMQAHDFDWLGDYLDAARNRLAEQLEGAARLEFEVKMSQRELRVGVEHGSEEAQATELSGRADVLRYDHSMAVASPDGAGSQRVAKQGRKRKATKRTAAARPGDGEILSIWEIKLVAKLSLEHAIQACIYGYLWTMRMQDGQAGDVLPLPRIILFNIRDGEKWEIKAKSGVSSLRGVVEEVVRAKYTTRDTLTTDEFVRKCTKTSAEVEGYWKSGS